MQIRRALLVFLVLSFNALAFATPYPRKMVPAEAPHSARVIIVGFELDHPDLTVKFPLRLREDGTPDLTQSATVVTRLPELIEVIVPRGAITGPVSVGFATGALGTFSFTVSSDPAIATVGTTAGGPGSSSFTGPTGIAMDATGTQFVVDTATHQIKKINNAGQVVVLAGSGASGFTNGTGLSAKFKSPSEMVAIDSEGNLFVTDTGNHAIRKVTSAGVVTTVAGGTAGDVDGSLSAARFRSPKGIAVDGTGTLYIADTENKKIRKISGNTVSTVTTLSLKPRGITLAGNALYVTAGHQVLQVSLLPVSVAVVAGSSVAGYADGTAAESRFKDPAGIVSDTEAANLFVADTGNNVIRKIDIPYGPLSGCVTTTVAGSYPTIGYIDGPPLSAQFSAPTGLSLQGVIVVGDKANRAARALYSELRLTRIYPDSFPLSGSQVRLFGTGFTPTSIVRVGNIDATSSYVSSTLLLAAVPPGSTAGPVEITVTTPAGTATLAAVYVGPPTIDTISPTRGSSYYGATVSITGGGFIEEGTTVYFGSNISPSVTVNSNSILTATAPPVSDGEFAGFVDVRIVTTGGEVTRSNGFEYVAFPKITGFSPTKGPLGSTIRIFLQQFEPASFHSVTHGSSPCHCDTSDDGFNSVVTPTHVDIRLMNNFLPEPISSAPGKIKLWTFWGQPISQETYTVLGTTSLSVTPASANLTVGSTLQLTAVAHLSDGSTLDVTDVTSFNSSNTVVATVGDDSSEVGGLVQALTVGNATITATFPWPPHPPTYSGTVQIQVLTAEPVPPDPSTVASPIDRTITTSFAEAIRFLYTGANPIQTGVAETTIERARAAVIRGRVLSSTGAALPAVRISVLNHPEFGQTLSRADGRYDLAVNGGGHLTLRFEKTGYIAAQRQALTPWRDYVAVEDVVLLQYDVQVSSWTAGAGETQFARGSIMTDNSGTRRATLIMPAATTVTMTLSDGSTQTLSTLNVRATELSVGANGPKAMPAALPPQSGYTYCVELSADEAVTVGARNVTFSKPLAFYVENFLNFPVGGIVPAGYYDRLKGAWIPAENGVVLKILSIVSGSATLDTNGDGAADSDATLTALGIDAAERQRLATLYAAGQTLWRVPIPHFTPWDCNWPFGPPTGAKGPAGIQPFGKNHCPDPDNRCGSIIETQNQVLAESMGITGSPLRLRYQGDRVFGRKSNREVSLNLTGATIPPGLKRVDLEIEVAGRLISSTFPGASGQTTSFVWDGVDAYGRKPQGQVPLKIKMGYVYDGVYNQTVQQARSFGAASGVPITGSLSRQEVTLWQEWESESTGWWNADSQGLGGWSLDAYHSYDFSGRVPMLFEGNGTWRPVTEAFGAVVSTVAGNGTNGTGGDGGPATQAQLQTPEAVAVGPDGSLYIAHVFTVRRVTPDGVITKVAGGNQSGDGIPAVDANVGTPKALAVAPDGALYIAGTGSHRVRRVGLDGIISTVAGSDCSSFSGDGGPATAACLDEPHALAVGPDGSLYIGGTSHHRVRRVGPDGIIMTVAGNGSQSTSGDGGPAIEAGIGDVYGLASTSDGTFYIAEKSGHRIRKVTPDGIITTVAGMGEESSGGDRSGDKGPATAAKIAEPWNVALGPENDVHFGDTFNYWIRRIDQDGNLQIIAGTGVAGFQDGPATAAKFNWPRAVAVAPDGSVYVADNFNFRVRKVRPSLPGFGSREVLISSNDGSQVFVFDEKGRHLRTLHAHTGAVLYRFTRDTNGLLSTIEDADGLITTIERSPSGIPTAIVAPGGQRTTLVVTSGYLESMTNPAGEQFSFTYIQDGLLRTLTNPRIKVTTFDYDTLGRLFKETDSAAGVQTLARSDDGRSYTTTVTTPAGRTSSYKVDNLVSGNVSRTNTLTDGTIQTASVGRNGTSTLALPDGTSVTVTEKPDPRWGMQSPLSGNLTVVTPGGRTLITTEERTMSLSSAGNPLSLISETTTFKLNNRIYTNLYEAATRKLTTTTPENRQMFLTIDVKGRPIEAEVSGLTKLQYGYEARGFLSSLTQGVRTTAFTYDTAGNFASMTDPLSRTVSFSYDLAGRVLTQTLPDTRVIGFTYDANGNITSITPPGRPAHAFGYTSVDLENLYTPPSVAGTGATQYQYNLDRDLIQVIRPDSTTIILDYDTGGRLSTITTSSGAYTYSYTANGNLASISAPGGSSTSYSFDGFLLTGSTWSGPVAGSVSWSYDNDFRVTSETAAGAAINFSFDADSLLTAAGALTLSRNAQNGLLTDTTVGNITDSYSYNTFGEVTGYTASYNTVPVFSVSYTRDTGGRVSAKTETMSGTTTAFGYGYDAAGRLTSVTRDGSTVSSYTYDSNSNRLTHNSTSGTYDAQDRLLTYAGATYTYTANGELLTKSDGIGMTQYEYDALGNLRKVTLPGGTVIEYVIDGQNRRIGRKVNGTLTHGWLYADQLRIVAELDGTGALISRFVYGSRLNVPDYVVKGGTAYRIISDHLGSPRLVMDATTGETLQRMEYDEFGNVTTDTNAGFHPFGFAGGLYDSQTKLVRFGARDYDAQVGRWTAKDPIFFDGGDMNLFGYVANDPVNEIDPSGLSTKLVGLFCKTAKGQIKRISRKAAEKALKNKKRVHVAGPGASKKARKLAHDQWGSQKKRHDAHNPGEKPHWQHRSGLKKGGKLTYEVPLAAVGQDLFGDSWLGSIVDFLNPLADLQEAYDIVYNPEEWLFGEESQEESLENCSNCDNE